MIRLWSRISYPMKTKTSFTLLKLLAGSVLALGLARPLAGAEAAGPTNPFEARSAPALQAMRARAGQLKISGVAVLSFSDGPSLLGWTSKMVVVGRDQDAPSAKDAGANLLAIAYAKSAEMALTLKDSGHAGRPLMTGETGWQGGVIREWNGGYLIAAFSGGKSEDDVQVALAGVAAIISPPAATPRP